MGHKNKKSLTQQVEERLQSMCRFGQSRYEAKQNGSDRNGIYSYSTYYSYLKWSYYFAKYCISNHHCKTIDSCRPYVDEWLTGMADRYSTYTIKLAAASLAKLFGCSATDFVETQARKRADITRSRVVKGMDSHFSETKNSDLVTVCRSTGLRRHEVAALRGTDLVERGGKYYVHVRKGKGGKERYVQVIGDVYSVVSIMRAAGESKVFNKVHSAADIHGYRREYATRLYAQCARAYDKIRRNERYYCRRDKRGVVYDRRAMLIVSRNLGHNRINVIAEHYLDSPDNLTVAT